MIGWTNMADGGVNIQNNKAVIHVFAPVGSTISFIKNGIITFLKMDKSFIDTTENTMAHWYYSISPNNYGEWTITATLGTDTASNTIVINYNKQYNVILFYNTLYIIYKGNYWDASLVKYQGADEVPGPGYRIYKTTTGMDTTYYTDTQIDLTDYSLARIVSTGGIWKYAAYFGFTSTKKTYDAGMFKIANKTIGAQDVTTTISQPTTIDIDISNVTGLAWFGFSFTWSGQVSSSEYGTGGYKVTDIYLVK